MSIPIPKILPAFTLDAALTLQLYISSAGDYDTGLEVTVPAGTYFMRWDGQSDDFLRVLHLACYTALDGCAVAYYNGANNTGKPMFSIDSDHKVVINIVADASHPLKFKWSEDDGATVAGILGFDSTSDTNVDSTHDATADWQHAYGWYASEEGQLAGDATEDSETAHVAQARAVGGQVATQYLASVYENHFQLRWLLPEDTFSRGVGYTTAPVDPYERNRGLECLWRAIRDGTRFCVYRDSTIDTTKAEERGTATGGAATTLIDAGKAWGIDPQEHDEKLVLVTDWDNNDHAMRYFVGSHDATTITVANSINNTVVRGTGDFLYYVFDQRYRTYVLDLSKMKTFAPMEITGVDRYEIDLPLLRYVA